MGILVPLDKTGNSVKGQLVAGFLSRRLGMYLFVSAPED
jgi:glutaminase